MRTILLWLGVALYVFGVVLILSNVVMYYLGFNTSFELSDPKRLQFSVRPLLACRAWHCRDRSGVPDAMASNSSLTTLSPARSFIRHTLWQQSKRVGER